MEEKQKQQGMEGDKEDDEDDVPKSQQYEFDEELDSDSFSYEEKSENLDQNTYFFGDKEEANETYDWEAGCRELVEPPRVMGAVRRSPFPPFLGELIPSVCSTFWLLNKLSPPPI